MYRVLKGVKLMKKSIILSCSFMLFLSFTFSGCEKTDVLSSENKQKVQQFTLSEADNDTLELNLYFNSSKDNKKVTITKEERIIKENELIGEIIVRELIKGPAVNSSLSPILPKNTRLLSFSINDGIAYVNLSKEAILTMSPVAEEACLRSLVWSLTQLPSIDKIKILVENKTVDTLGGNFNIAKPIGKLDVEQLEKK